MYFMEFIAAWGYVAIAVLMAAENACIPIPSELILGFAGYLIFDGQLGYAAALAAGMYGRYFFIKKHHVDIAQNWFDRYGLKAVFFSRMLPVVRTFISLPAGFAHVDKKKFVLLTFAGALPWTALILAAGMMLGKSWQVMLAIGHEASIVFVAVCAVVIAGLYLRHRRQKAAARRVTE